MQCVPLGDVCDREEGAGLFACSTGKLMCGDKGVLLYHLVECIVLRPACNVAAYTGSDTVQHLLNWHHRSPQLLISAQAQLLTMPLTPPLIPPPPTHTQCGCQCTKCCYQGDTNNCTSISRGTCPYDCLARNKTNCGVQFSTPRQSIFCAIPHTSAWPPILQVGGGC